ncbi:MAG TPA: HypC/HybG/HupF family hydrogenase formation chaperone [Symbiobacteriaceae bacterium]|nr:HypC/HybG/HupF family hydrogenase formation chaperone [Symbiobacteriaceae bacterium]
MCLAVPVKVLEVSGRQALVDLQGNRRKVDISLVDAVEPGCYVLMHAGIALQVLNEQEALETLKLLTAVMDHVSDGDE